MATKKALKLEEDAYRLGIENGIKTILASQEQVIEELRVLSARLKAIGQEKQDVKVKSQK